MEQNKSRSVIGIKNSTRAPTTAAVTTTTNNLNSSASFSSTNGPRKKLKGQGLSHKKFQSPRHAPTVSSGSPTNVKSSSSRSSNSHNRHSRQQSSRYINAINGNGYANEITPNKSGNKSKTASGPIPTTNNNSNNNNISCPSSTTSSTAITLSVASMNREREKTQSVNTAFTTLRTLIPTEPADRKLSKIETLRLASSYIAHLSSHLLAEEINGNTSHIDPQNQATQSRICTFCLSESKKMRSITASSNLNTAQNQNVSHNNPPGGILPPLLNGPTLNTMPGVVGPSYQNRSQNQLLISQHSDSCQNPLQDLTGGPPGHQGHPGQTVDEFYEDFHSQISIPMGFSHGHNSIHHYPNHHGNNLSLFYS